MLSETKIEKGQFYRHHSGTVYYIHGISSDGFVIYQDTVTFKLWSRPLSSFSMTPHERLDSWTVDPTIVSVITNVDATDLNYPIRKFRINLLATIEPIYVPSDLTSDDVFDPKWDKEQSNKLFKVFMDAHQDASTNR